MVGGFNAILSSLIPSPPSPPPPHPPNRPKDQHANPEWTPGPVPAAAQSDSRGEGDVRSGLQEEQRDFPWQGQPGAHGRGKWISHSVNGGGNCLFAKVSLFAGEPRPKERHAGSGMYTRLRSAVVALGMYLATGFLRDRPVSAVDAVVLM